MTSEWMIWGFPAIGFVLGLSLVILAHAYSGRVDVGNDKQVGYTIMTFAAVLGISGYFSAQDSAREKTERQIIDEKYALLEKAETDRRLELISEKLDVEQSEVIVYPARNGLFNAETSDGKYLIEFDETHEEIAKMIKLPN